MRYDQLVALLGSLENGWQYPSIVELGLQGYEFAFFLVLGAEDLELGGFQRSVKDVSVARIKR